MKIDTIGDITVLQVLIIHMVPHIQLANNKHNTTPKHTHQNHSTKKYIRPGIKGKETITASRVGLFDKANDWKIDDDHPELHDKGSQYIFPSFIAVVTLHVDLVIYPIQHKIAILL